MPITTYRATLRTDETAGANHVVTTRMWPHLPNITLTALRLVSGLLFLQHGLQKHFGLLLAPGQPPFGSLPPFSMLWVAGALEIAGGLLLALGLFTRPVAFIISGEMAFAYFIGHARNGFFPAVNGGELAVLYCFVFLAFAAIGGGRYSLDHLIAGHHKSYEIPVDLEENDTITVEESPRGTM